MTPITVTIDDSVLMKLVWSYSTTECLDLIFVEPVTTTIVELHVGNWLNVVTGKLEHVMVYRTAKGAFIGRVTQKVPPDVSKDAGWLPD